MAEDTPRSGSIARTEKWRAVALLSFCQVLALGLWFSMSAVVPALKQSIGLSDLQASLLSSAVAVGFVVGTLVSAIFGLTDRIDPRRLFAAATLVAALANAGLLVVAPDGAGALGLRFLTGTMMAGIYPVGMKMVSTWAEADMGLLVGTLVGALTIGSASPHFFNAFGGLDWRLTITAASLGGLGAAALVGFVGLGPTRGKPPPFNAAYVLRAWTNRPLRLANLGYLGHMWELYAMWAWIGVFLYQSFLISFGDDPAAAAVYSRLGAFAVIAAGGVGSVVAGLLADRIGRTTVTMTAMAVSGSCALGVGLLFGGDPVALMVLSLIWGVAVVADSAQFSSSVIELSEPDIVGTMLTVQTCVGFTLTLITIHLIPVLAAAFGWNYAFAILAVGPFLGVWAMARLRRHPSSRQMAGGNR